MNDESYVNECFLIGCRSSSYQNQLGLVDIIELLDLTRLEVEKCWPRKNLGQLSPAIEELATNRSMLRLILELRDKNFQTQVSSSAHGSSARWSWEMPPEITLTSISCARCWAAWLLRCYARTICVTAKRRWSKS